MSEPNIKVQNLKTDMNDSLTKNLLMSKFRIIKNLLILCLGFVFLYSAFMALGNLQSTMNNAGSVGVVSQSVIYTALIVSSLFLPKLLIKRFGCKITLVLSILAYSPYIAANFYPTMSTLLPTAILLGAGAANLWTAAFSYINELSFMDAEGDTVKAALSASTFFGIFMMFIQTTQIWGNLVSFYVLSPSTMISDIHQNTSVTKIPDFLDEEILNISCGAEFCGGIDQKLSPLSDTKRSTLIGIFYVFSIIAAAVVLLFLDPLKQNNTKKDDGILQKLIATFVHTKKIEQLLLIILTTFTGLEQGFVFADYSEAYVTCAIGLQSVGLVFVCFGIVNAISAVIVGRLLEYVPRMAMLATAAASNFGVCVTLFLWKPDAQQVSVFYILISFWGFSDAIWQTQLSALYGALFRNDEEAAFASYTLWEALGYLIAFSCSSYLCTSSKIYMLIGFLVVGMAGYIALEIRNYLRTDIMQQETPQTSVLKNG